MRVGEGRRAHGLALEALGEFVVPGVLHPEHLEGDVAIKYLVVGQVDLAHASKAKGLYQCVTIIDDVCLHRIYCTRRRKGRPSPAPVSM